MGNRQRKPAVASEMPLQANRIGCYTEGMATYLKRDGADYIWLQTGSLPDYYLTKEEARAKGWRSRKGNLGDVLPGIQIGGNVFYNDEGKLPDAPGRIWYEADINYDKGLRNGHRILYSSGGLIFVTYNHYHSFYEVIGGTSW